MPPRQDGTRPVPRTGPGRRVAYEVVSAIPGRVRVQLTERQAGPTQLEETARRLAQLASVTKAEPIPGARSVLITYRDAEGGLAGMLRAIDSALGAHQPHASRPRAPRGAANRRAPSGSGVSVAHSFPGRLRVCLPRRPREREFSSRLVHALGAERGVQQVEACADGAFVILRYDARTREAAELVRLIERLIASPEAVTPHPPAEAHDAPAHKSLGLRHLLLPTIAVVVSATGALPTALTGVALSLAALPLTRRAMEGVRERRFNVDQLDLSALIVLALRGDFLIGSLMTWLIGLGDFIRTKTMGRARREVSSLLPSTEQQVRVQREDGVVLTPVNALKRGDLVLVYPGDRIPVDGFVTSGRALVDQKTLTGEPMPVTKEEGEAVFALTMVVDGQVGVRVEHTGRETRAGQVVEMIENAPLSDTRVQNYAAKVGDRLVGPIFGLALMTYLLGGDSLRVAGVLILDFASGIRVSAPTTILTSMVGAAKEGLFIKGGKALEKLAEVDAVVFDKTGTLTRAAPVVAAVHTLDPAVASEEVLRLAASAEANLAHPAAKAIVDAAKARRIDIAPSDQIELSPGLGVKAVVESRTVQVGSERYLRQLGVDTAAATALTADCLAAGHSLTYVVADGRLIGLLAYFDPPRPESADVVRALADRGVKRIVMMTGDHARAAQAIADRVGITEVIAEAFPEDKAEAVQRLCDEGYTVAVVGDGINDSPAFTRADVGISLLHGADVAKEAADVILLDEGLDGLPRAIDRSVGAMRILRQNVNIVVWPTAVGIGASILGRTTPLLSTLISHGTTIIAGINGLRPLYLKAEPAKKSPICDATRTGSRPVRRRSSVSRDVDAPKPLWPVVKRLPTYLRLAWALAREPGIPWRHKALLYLYPVYYVSPVHLLVHPVPVLGQIDGAAFLVAALRQALAHCPPEVLARHLSRLSLLPTQLDEDWETVRHAAWRALARLVGYNLHPSRSADTPAVAPLPVRRPSAAHARPTPA